MKGFLCRFIIIIAAVFLFIFLGEVYLKYFSYYGVDSLQNFGDELLSRDPEIIWENPYAMETLEPYFYDKNSAQESDKYRILVIGDSIACGGKLKKGDIAFPAIVEELLNKKYGKDKFKVLTYASGGYSTKQEVRFYETKGKLLKPDLLILAYCYNDTAELSPRITKNKGRYILRYYRTDIPYLNKLPFNRYFTEKLLLSRLMNEALIKLSKKYNLPISLDYCFLPHEKIHAYFRRLAEVTKNSGTSVAIAVFPPLSESLTPDKRRMHRSIKKWCREFNFLNIDLLEEYRQYNSLKLRADSNDNCHPNQLGHKIAAEYIVEKLKKNYLRTK